MKGRGSVRDFQLLKGFRKEYITKYEGKKYCETVVTSEEVQERTHDIA